MQRKAWCGKIARLSLCASLMCFAGPEVLAVAQAPTGVGAVQPSASGFASQTILQLSPNGTTYVTAAETATITVQDPSTGAGLGGVPVTLTQTRSDGSVTTAGTATTASTGKATVSFLAPAGGTYSYVATSTATGSYAGSTSAAVVTTTSSPFTITTLSPVTLAPGGTVASTVTVAPASGFLGTVSLACTSPVSYLTCSLAQNSVTITSTSGSNAASTTVMLSLASTKSALTTSPAVQFASLLPLGVLALFFLLWRRPRVLRLPVVLIGLLAIGAAATGCGHSGGVLTASPNTPSGTYAVTITGTTAAGYSGTGTASVMVQN